MFCHRTHSPHLSPYFRFAPIQGDPWGQGLYFVNWFGCSTMLPCQFCHICSCPSIIRQTSKQPNRGQQNVVAHPTGHPVHSSIAAVVRASVRVTNSDKSRALHLCVNETLFHLVGNSRFKEIGPAGPSLYTELAKQVCSRLRDCASRWNHAI